MCWLGAGNRRKRSKRSVHGVWQPGKSGLSTYDKSRKIPVIRSGIRTGKINVGFNLVSGRFEELMLLRDDKDFVELLQWYQVDEDEIKREW